MNKRPYLSLERARDEGISFGVTKKSYGIVSLIVYFFSIGIALSLLSVRLFQLTVVKGAYYRSVAEDNRLREIVVEPKRGTLFDRNGVGIAENLPPDLTRNDQRIISTRTYTGSPEAYGHLIGYRQKNDKTDLENDECLYKTQLGDKVGKKGAEKRFECELRGKHGKKLIEVDAHGKPLRTISAISPVAGKDIFLSIDNNIQESSYDQIRGLRAAVVALKPGTGEVLAMVSSPTFNPQIFEDTNGKAAQEYLSNEEKPLFNRATEGTYPPGSVFKMVVAAAGLEEKVIDMSYIIDDKGYLEAGGRRFGNWYYIEQGRTEGTVDVVKSLQRSNDIFYYEVGGKLGPEKIKKWAELFGYGTKSQIGIEEKTGTLPSPFWKKDVLNEQWFLGDSYNFSIGQGYLLTTPLQVAISTAIIAADGYNCQARLTKLSDGEIPRCERIPISPETLKILKTGMKKACETGGTARPFFNFGIEKNGVTTPLSVACKTGTAESHGSKADPHAWFTIMAPAESPEIVLTVLVENGGQGSNVAAPIAKEILTTYFRNKQ